MSTTFDKIFLIGFMGSGKSFFGKKLARLLHFDFIDMDIEIERQTKKSILEIFNQEGETFFREKEQELLKNLSRHKNTVIATGGGTPCFFDNMLIMNQNGLTIYLQLSPKVLAHRISNRKNHRPLLQSIENEHLNIAIKTLLQQREPFYNQSQITVDAYNLTAQKIYDKLIESGYKPSN